MTLQFFPFGSQLQTSVFASNEGVVMAVDVLIAYICLITSSGGICIRIYTADTIRGPVIDPVHLPTVVMDPLIDNIRGLRQCAGYLL